MFWHQQSIHDIQTTLVRILFPFFHRLSPTAVSLPSSRSAFFIFCADFRPQVKGETPGLSIGDVAKKLGEKWNNLTAEDKVPYEKKAAKLKEKYEKVNKQPFFCSFINLEDL